MASLTLTERPLEAEAPDLLRLVPSAAVLVGVIALFASVGGGLTRDVPQDPAVESGLQRDEEVGQVIPKSESDPSALVPVTALEAWEMNEALPTESGPNPAANAFTLPADEVARMRSIDCLTAAIYYEAGNEPTDGQRGVAQVVLNRVRHPAYPNTVCGVVFQGHQRSTGCQFSFTCDGSLRRTPVASIWARSRAVAEAALAGYVHRPVGWATHYHANYVFPYWAPTLTKVATIGAHIFYRWDRGGSLNVRYAGAEPDIRWRGGFGQPDRAQLAAAAAANAEAAAAATVGERDAAAAQAAQTAQGQGGNSVIRTIIRRYEPVNSDNAPQMIRDRMASQPAAATGTPAPATNRWSLTGEGTGDQRPLGRDPAAAPGPLSGVRRAPTRLPMPAAPPEPANSSEPK